jgi:hypothetical protein
LRTDANRGDGPGLWMIPGGGGLFRRLIEAINKSTARLLGS